MRVLMLTSSYPLRPGDWRGSFVRDLARALVREGLDVEVAAPRPPDEAPEEAEEPPADEPRVSWLPAVVGVKSRAFHGLGMEANLAKDPAAALMLAPFLAAFAGESALKALFSGVVIANWIVPMGLVASVVGRISGRPFGIVAHSGPPALARVPPLSGAVRGALGRAASVACVSESVRDEVVRAAPAAAAERIEALPLGVELRPSAPRPAGAGPWRVLFVGRLVRIKGADVLLRSLAGLPGVQVTLAGDGPEAPALRDLAASLGVAARFAGEVDHDEARRLMQSHDCLVVPSREGRLGRREGLPRVVVEAWACGLPVVAASTGGLTGALQARGGGMLFGTGEAGDLRRVLEDLRGDAGLRSRLRDEALAAAQATSWHVQGPRWADWVRRVAAGR